MTFVRDIINALPQYYTIADWVIVAGWLILIVYYISVIFSEEWRD